MVKNLPSNAGGVGLIPGLGSKIPHTSQPKKQQHKTEAIIVTNSIKTLKIKNKELDSSINRVCVSCSVKYDFATPWTVPSVHGILQARILEWVFRALLQGGGLPDPGIDLHLLHYRQIFYH